jgi:hypothetical protein
MVCNWNSKGAGGGGKGVGGGEGAVRGLLGPGASNGCMHLPFLKVFFYISLRITIISVSSALEKVKYKQLITRYVLSNYSKKYKMSSS